ncbi:MAG: 2-oxoglutarate dehydrogenase E1 component [Alphaproteobacteria bacterium]|nr:MAG: 2-oxoglutarate dehydrogenase E1 component [Alphaproteobacteria bacterium]
MSHNRAYIEALYHHYITNPESLDPSWRAWFQAENQEPLFTGSDGQKTNDDVDRTIKALMFIRSYRVRGHLHAALDPLNLEKRPAQTELDPITYGFEAKDREIPIVLNGVLGFEKASICTIEERLKRVYSHHIGVEFMHIQDPEQKKWIQLYVENHPIDAHITSEDRLAILTSLARADIFESFLKAKFPGAKRFGLEGGEALIPGLNALLEVAANESVRDISVGMAHRGRLNVLANVLDKKLAHILFDFLDRAPTPNSTHLGDVKYHKGFSTDRTINTSQIHLNLADNPSHLEAVNPIVAGRVRAKQAYFRIQNPGENPKDAIMGLLIHGDAAFAGQGLVAETLMLSELPGYECGGIIHVIINNQIGFTTKPKHGRSSPYPSDVMKMIQAPVLHVNGDDPEAVVFCCRMAMEFRQRFHKDILIDLHCYRRMGHNEMDEPSYTQPLMYACIGNHKNVYTQYKNQGTQHNFFSPDEIQKIEETIHNDLESAFVESQKMATPPEPEWKCGAWKNLAKKAVTKTAITRKIYDSLARTLTTIPHGFHIHPKLKRQLETKKAALAAGRNLDWAIGEALAFGSLVHDGFHVRLSGQDSGRGTFAHRHGRWIDTTNECTHTPLEHIGRGVFELIDSPLCEASVMGFEYGFSLTDPRNFVMWEAQFGDFSNGAQVIIDQFLACAESKWHRLNGLVLLLPHGYEGQGSEHSSARLERFLQMSSQENWTVANCTTPANFFHLLRKNVAHPTRKPLIIMTPKSLLRHKLAVSSREDFISKSVFLPLLPDPDNPSSTLIKTVVLCSGKIFYDLLVHRRETQRQSDVALIRVEQLYPFPHDQIIAELIKYPHAKVLWAQEEPENMGAWTYMDRKIETVLLHLKRTQIWPQKITRLSSASPATGSPSQHAREQEAIIAEIFSQDKKANRK